MTERVELEVVIARALSLNARMEKMRKYAALPDEEFRADERNILSVKHLLLQAMEDAASMCSRLSARLGGEAPSGYADGFKGLERLGVLSPELAPRIVAMARLRNPLLHRYWGADDIRVLEFARRDAGDLRLFLQDVGDFVRTRLV
jgi:uncharacterized protein YutE (UPF0331/DUF86 family)